MISVLICFCPFFQNSLLLGQLLSYFHSIVELPTSRAASFLYVQPLLVLGIAWVWLGEWPSVLALIGGALVLAGVIVVNARRQGVAEISPLRFR